jgi:hypothetical protein
LRFRSSTLRPGAPSGRLSIVIDQIADHFDKAEKRNRVLRILWFLCTFAMIVLTLILCGALAHFFGWKIGAFSAVLLWAIYLGACGLLFLPPKAMTAVFGTSFGISVSEISSGAGLIEAANKGIASLAAQISGIVSSGPPDPFIKVLLWMFLIVILLLAFPAFFAIDKKPVDAGDRPSADVGEGKRITFGGS